MKDWLWEVGLKTMGPSAVRGAVLGLSGWLLARNGLLTPFGIVSDAVAHTLTIHYDQLSIATIAALPALLAAVIKLVNHKGSQLIQGDQKQP